MARTRKNTPPAVETAPALDFDALAAEVIEDKLSSGAVAYNPFTDLIRSSFYADKRGENPVRSNAIPGYSVAAFVRKLRNAASQLSKEIGLRLRFAYTDDAGVAQEHGKQSDVPEDDRRVRVLYWGRPRKIYLSEEQKEEAVAQGFVIGNSDPPKIDAPRYVAWLKKEQAEAEGDENGDIDLYQDDEAADEQEQE